MGDAPRRFLDDPSAFGKDDAVWAPAAAQSPVDVATAWLQHRLSMTVREALAQHRTKQTDFAKAQGVKAQTVTNKLNGSDPLQLRDLVAWTMLLGVEVVPALDVPLPPAYRPWIDDWEPGNRRLPVIEAPRQDGRPRIRWAASALHLDRTVQELANVDGAHLLTEPTVRDSLVRGLVAEGVAARHITVADTPPGSDMVADLVIGPEPFAVVRIVRLDEPAGARAAARLARAVVTALVELSEAEAGERVLVVTAGPTSWRHVTDRLGEIGGDGSIRIGFEKSQRILGRSAPVHDLDIECIHRRTHRGIVVAVYAMAK